MNHIITVLFYLIAGAIVGYFVRHHVAKVRRDKIEDEIEEKISEAKRKARKIEDEADEKAKKLRDELQKSEERIIKQEERLDIEFHNMNCDLLFQDIKSGLWFCYEIKFQDGRDAFTQQGYLKKLLLLYAGIIHEVQSINVLPQLYYFLPPGNTNLCNYLYFNHDSQFFTFHQLEMSYNDILLDFDDCFIPLL